MQYKAFTTLLLAVGLAPSFAHAASSAKESSQPVTSGHYIVVLKSPQKLSFMTTPGFSSRQADFVADQALRATNEVGAQVTKKFHNIIDGYVVKANKQQAQELAKQPDVAYVEPDYPLSLSPAEMSSVNSRSAGTEQDADWGLARIDQGREYNPYDNSYLYEYLGKGVDAYVLDTGVNITHSEFDGRADLYVNINDQNQEEEPRYVQDTQNEIGDCNGHGTHVAGTIGGSQYGVAKGVRIIGVKVLNCKGHGSASGLIAGLSEVLRLARKSGHPSVVNMSLGFQGHIDVVDQAVQTLIDNGITVVAAAGNKNPDRPGAVPDACLYSPADIGDVITVGATDEYDERAEFSYLGSCTDIFAPGTDITSAWKGGDYSINTISGTSMASPHVAGVVALYLEENPDLSPAEVKRKLIRHSTKNAIDIIGQYPDRYGYDQRLAPETSNNLLYSLTN